MRLPLPKSAALGSGSSSLLGRSRGSGSCRAGAERAGKRRCWQPGGERRVPAGTSRWRDEAAAGAAPAWPWANRALGAGERSGSGRRWVPSRGLQRPGPPRAAGAGDAASGCSVLPIVTGSPAGTGSALRAGEEEASLGSVP